MRDIRDDLKQRVDLLKQERDQLQVALKAKLEELDAYEAQLSSLLALEEKRLQSAGFFIQPPPQPPIPPAFIAPPPLPPPPPWSTLATPPIADGVEDASDDAFEADILKCLADGQPHEHSAIKKHMEDAEWSMEKGSLGRAIQGQLLSMKQRGAVEYLGDSKWRKLPSAAAA